MKKLYYLIILTVILGLVLTGCFLSNVGQVPTTEQSGITYLTKGTEAEPDEFPLYAGQDMLVGNVLVWDDGIELCVKYQLSAEALAEGWLLTETHLAVANDVSGIPTNKSGNPVPGKFPYGDDELGGVEEDGPYCIEFGEEEGQLNVDCVDIVVIAAHAVIEKTECELLMEAPYGAYTVTEFTQGLRKDGSDVRIGRSAPDAVLTWDTIKDETDFFSLGFGGEIIVEFDCCIANGEGHDVLVVEDTWGGYPLETANVFASVDGDNWVFLGEADNTTRDTTNVWQTVSEFDLGELECAKYIKVVDTTNIGPMPDNGDGYDLNTIQALQDCVQCTTYDESAWGANKEEGTMQFVDSKSWATYFTYDIEIELPPIISSEDLAGPFTEGVLGEFHVKTVNPGCGVAYPNVLFNYIIKGISTSEINTFEYWYCDELTSEWKWGEMPKENDGLGNVTGFFGPWPDGFEMTVPYTAETKFRINITTPSTYEVTMTLNDLNDSNAVLATFTEYVVVNPI